MTHSEAIKYIQGIQFERYLHCETLPPYAKGKFAKGIDALGMAIEALQKQMPLEIEKVEPYDLTAGHCPICKSTQYMADALFCWKCGQRIQWED